MAIYTCPTCNATMKRDMLLFYKHTDQHIVDELKKQNPEWVSDDGYCPKCLDFFKRQMGKSGVFGMKQATNPSLVNISLGGVRQRTALGLVALGAALLIFILMVTQHTEKIWRLILFIPLLIGMLGLIQAREEVCVVFGARGTQNLNGKEEKIPDQMLAKALRQASKQIWFLSLALALLLTGVAWFV